MYCTLDYWIDPVTSRVLTIKFFVSSRTYKLDQESWLSLPSQHFNDSKRKYFRRGSYD